MSPHLIHPLRQLIGPARTVAAAALESARLVPSDAGLRPATELECSF